MLLVALLSQLLLMADLTLVDGQYDNPFNYDLYGVKVAINQQMIAVARNDYQFFSITCFNSTAFTQTCNIPYYNSSMYVHSIAIIADTSGQIVVIGEDTLSLYQLAIILTANCASASFYVDMQYFTVPTRYPVHEEYYVMAVDPHGQFAYGFANDFMFIYQMQSPYTFSLLLTTAYSIYLNPRTADIDNGNNCLLLGHDNIYGDYFVPTIYLLQLQPLSGSIIQIDVMRFIETWILNQVLSIWTIEYDMSVAMKLDEQVALVGIPFLYKVMLISYNNSKFIILKNYPSESDNANIIGYGQSVGWLSDTSSFFIQVPFQRTPNILSEIRLYSSTLDQNIPFLVVPNNQQRFRSLSSPRRLINVVSDRRQSVAMLDDSNTVWLFTSSSPGVSSLTEVTGTSLIEYDSCPAGTFRKTAGFLPCSICPEGTNNFGNTGATQCLPCNSTLFCPAGAIVEIDYSLIYNQTQIQVYPQSPENIVFDDILLANMFSISNTRSMRCILISPLFWTTVTLSISLMMLLTLHFLKCFPNHFRHQRLLLIRIFKQADLIGEGELWTGGLASIGIVVMATFASIFSHFYLNQYPIESVHDQPFTFACDHQIRNAKFSTNLQLLALPRSSDEQRIFDLLDQQQFTLHLDLIGTRYRCEHLTHLLQNNVESAQAGVNCSTKTASILSFTAPLQSHTISVQFNLTDNYWANTVGALRLGLTGPSFVDSSYTIRALEFYQLFFISNATIGQFPKFHIQLTKIINETQSLKSSDTGNTYSGLFIPALFESHPSSSLSDETHFAQNGNYLRYVQTHTLVTVEIDELSTYVKNLQEPIARQAEIIFHTLLFTMLCIEIFALSFLIFKLFVIPLYGEVMRKLAKRYRRVGIAMEEDEENERKTNVIEKKEDPTTVSMDVTVKVTNNPHG